MNYDEDDSYDLGFAALVFCPRQCALIHIGAGLGGERPHGGRPDHHEKVHEEGNESRASVRIRGVCAQKPAVGLVGVADVVEFHKSVRRLQPVLVEYNEGNPSRTIAMLYSFAPRPCV